MLTRQGRQPQTAAADFTQLPAALSARLAAEGISDLAQWRRLSRQRKRSIFGITRAMAAQLDELAQENP